MMNAKIMEMLDDNVVYLATSTPNGVPNVVPVGLCKAINDRQLLIGDVLFDKTRKNLEANPNVAISFTDFKRMGSYQLKGVSEIHTEGPVYERMKEIREQKEKRKQELLSSIDVPKEVMEKAQQRKEWRKNLPLKSAVLVTVEEIFSHMQKHDGK